MEKIITYHEFPPIPDRTHDWVAYFEGEEEYGNALRGWGRTEQEAIDDLKKQYEEENVC